MSVPEALSERLVHSLDADLVAELAPRVDEGARGVARTVTRHRSLQVVRIQCSEVDLDELPSPSGRPWFVDET